MTSIWGSVEPAESSQSRLRLDFGLRPAILALNEWAVPGLGGAYFVRQLTWSCLGIMLAGELERPTMAAPIAEAIEALASWIALGQGGYEKSDQVQGKRKLRNLSSISFDAVSRGGAYVTVPFRRAATAALPGLGFCNTVESRFNNLALSSAGLDLANTVLADDTVAKRLRTWISAAATPISSTSKALKQAILPDHTTAEECRLVFNQLTAHPIRAHIAGLLQQLDAGLTPLQSDEGIADFLKRIDDRTQRARLDVCFAFERVRASALQAAQTLVDAIDVQAQPWAALAGSDEVKHTFNTLQGHCSALHARAIRLTDIPPELQTFCEEHSATVDLQQRTRAVAARLPQLFTLQAHALDRGIAHSRGLQLTEAIDPSDSEGVPAGVLVPRPLLRLRRLYAEALNGMAQKGIPHAA